jgi:hypothetical protein
VRLLPPSKEGNYLTKYDIYYMASSNLRLHTFLNS